MRNYFLLVLLLSANLIGAAQELYVFSNPASNIPAKSISTKITARSPNSQYNNYFKQRYIPEVMFGLNKKLMVSVSGTFSDFYSVKLRPESIKGYAKYRFLSKDDVHKHFRMAAFAEVSGTQSPYLYGDMSLNGDVDGMQLGITATQLWHKFALSGTVGYVNVFGDRTKIHHAYHSFNAINYTVAAGYLLFPKSYTSYNQTNLNLYVEMMGMKNTDNNGYMLDIAPAIQLIFNSKTKLSLGGSFQLTSNMLRVGEQTYQISVERSIFNAWK